VFGRQPNHLYAALSRPAQVGFITAYAKGAFSLAPNSAVLHVERTAASPITAITLPYVKPEDVQPAVYFPGFVLYHRQPEGRFTSIPFEYEGRSNDTTAVMHFNSVRYPGITEDFRSGVTIRLQKSFTQIGFPPAKFARRPVMLFCDPQSSALAQPGHLCVVLHQLGDPEYSFVFAAKPEILNLDAAFVLWAGDSSMSSLTVAGLNALASSHAKTTRPHLGDLMFGAAKVRCDGHIVLLTFPPPCDSPADLDRWCPPSLRVSVNVDQAGGRPTPARPWIVRDLQLQVPTDSEIAQLRRSLPAAVGSAHHVALLVHVAKVTQPGSASRYFTGSTYIGVTRLAGKLIASRSASTTVKVSPSLLTLPILQALSITSATMFGPISGDSLELFLHAGHVSIFPGENPPRVWYADLSTAFVRRVLRNYEYAAICQLFSCVDESTRAGRGLLAVPVHGSHFRGSDWLCAERVSVVTLPSAAILPPEFNLETAPEWRNSSYTVLPAAMRMRAVITRKFSSITVTTTSDEPDELSGSII